MPDPKSRARVERLLRSEFRPDDLTGLFLYARDHCDGREPVADIGHFVAHHNERDRGIITRSTREWFAIARYHMSRFRPGGPHPLDANKLPPAAQHYFEIAVNRIDAKLIRDKTGLRRPDAHRFMLDLAGRLTRNSDETWALPKDCTSTELRLVECVSSVIVVRPAFEAGRLCDDFLATLKSNGLITHKEIRLHKDALKTLVQLYAVAAMHNCVVQIGDGTTVQLRSSPSMGDKQINVLADVREAIPGYPNVAITSSIFTAHTDPIVHCHPDLLTGSAWNFEIEVSPDKRLAPLR